MMKSPKNALFNFDPVFEKQWDFERNTIDPATVGYSSNKKYWWICEEGHRWDASPNGRTNKIKKLGKIIGCRFCSNKDVLVGYNDILTTNPDLASEFREDFDPTKYVEGSGAKVWWKCLLGHEWSATIANRSYNKSGCRYCSGQYVLAGFNDFAYTHPELAKELDPKHDPTTFTHMSTKSLIWICPEGHEWSASCLNRLNGSSCRRCMGNPKSAIENDIRDMFSTWEGVDLDSKFLESNLDARWGNNNRMSVDILGTYKSIKFIVEYDGYLWHKDKIEVDTRKSQSLLAMGYVLIRLRDRYLPHLDIQNINLLQITTQYSRTPERITEIVQRCLDWMDNHGKIS